LDDKIIIALRRGERKRGKETGIEKENLGAFFIVSVEGGYGR